MCVASLSDFKLKLYPRFLLTRALYINLSLLLLFTLLCSFSASEKHTAQELAQRIIPKHSDRILFEHIEGIDKDVFSIWSENDKIIIGGNNANSMATGLNYYLKYYCKVTVTWYKDDKIIMPGSLPKVREKVTVESKLKDRFFLNYCTFGYSMNWWKWREWEHFIDWMALNGVNMALATTGQESIWREVWLDAGLTEEEIADYFTGPSYLPWHRMANIDSWHSQLPLSWIEHQYELQKQIIEREREFNIRPILTSFSGHVPKSLKRIYPNSKITRLNPWVDFEEEYNTYYLDASEPLFKEIQKKFLLKQKEMYGASHIYGIDPFNELDPPSWDPDYLAKAAKEIYSSVEEVDPGAVWMQMSWVFFHKRKDWTPERLKAYITAVPKNKLVMLDYYCDSVELWKQTESFYGQPYIWSYLGNFGGNTMIAGNIKDISKKIDDVYEQGGNNFQGLGCTLEGLDVNPFIYEYVLERAWDTKINDKDWFQKLADRHIGFEDDNYRKAWFLLYDKVYMEASTNKASMISGRPNMKGDSKWNSTNIKYNNNDLVKVWETLLKSPLSKSSSYEFDLVNIGRQALENYFGELFLQYLDAVKNKDIKAERKLSKQMLALLSDIESLVATNSYFLLGKWIKDARDLGENPQEKDYFEKDAKLILTTWGVKGNKLNDYANRSWAGLIGSYYKVRWKMFTNDAYLSLKNNQPFNEGKTYQKLIDFEWDWVNKKRKFIHKPKGDSRELSEKMYKKYFSVIGNHE